MASKVARKFQAETMRGKTRCESVRRQPHHRARSLALTSTALSADADALLALARRLCFSPALDPSTHSVLAGSPGCAYSRVWELILRTV